MILYVVIFNHGMLGSGFLLHVHFFSRSFTIDFRARKNKKIRPITSR